MISSEPNYQNNRPSLYFRALSGHRANYVRILGCYFDHILEDRNLSVFNRLDRLIRPSRLVFGMIDDDYFHFFFISFIRLILMKETSGFFVRPQTCFRPNFLSIAKLVLFFLFSKLPKINIYSLLPHYCFPKMKFVCSDYIYDPELWHLSENHEVCSVAEIPSIAGLVVQKSPTILVCGLIATHKGIKDLYDILTAGNLIAGGWRVIVAGKSPDDSESLEVRRQLESIGCISVNRYITDTELDHLYGISDYIWCSYDLVYDQSSGIFGTAIQRSKVPIVRSGTMIAKFAKHLSIDTINMVIDAPIQNSQRLIDAEYGKIFQRAQLDVGMWRCDFETKLDVRSM